VEVGLPVFPNRFKTNSLKSNPDIVKSSQAAIMASVEGMKPAAKVAVGKAKIPAPTVVPAMSATAEATEPGACIAVVEALRWAFPFDVYRKEL
jgi:hypothetical protein